MFQCKRCLYQTPHKHVLKSHLAKRKKACEVFEAGEDIPIQELLHEIESVGRQSKLPYKYQCEWCGTKFTQSSNKSIHKKTCSARPVLEERAQTQPSNNTHVDNITITLALQRENQRLRNELLKYKTKRNEDFYQVIVENWLGGSHETLSVGVTDVTTDTVHAEIKSWKEWKYALGQLTAYQDDCPKEQLHVYLFGPYDEVWKQKAIKTFNNKGIQCFEFREEQREAGDRVVSIMNAVTQQEIYTHALDG